MFVTNVYARFFSSLFCIHSVSVREFEYVKLEAISVYAQHGTPQHRIVGAKIHLNNIGCCL